MEQIKLIWDFRGQTAAEIAKHHALHLQEFLDAKNYTTYKAEFERITEFIAIAYIVVPKAEMLFFRDALKPHRGEQV